MTTGARGWRVRLLGVLLFAALGLVGVEIAGRLRFADTPYVPGPQIEGVQVLLALHPEVGFLWKPDVSPSRDFEITWRDAEPFSLSTDSSGFLNAPEAVARLAAGEPPDVVGLGDSFVQVATYIFQERFQEEGLFFYSFAMHRHGPPQYNRILTRYALRVNPRWVLYGITESDFADTFDFVRWEESGQDWFTFHSGIWCGPPSTGSRGLDTLRSAFGGTWAVWRALRARLRPGTLPRTVPEEVLRYVLEARDMAEEASARFLVLLIPEKRTTLGSRTADAALHEALAGSLRESGVEVVDLRTAFTAVADPASLFNHEDHHWNREGQTLAAERILDAIHRAD